MIAKYLVSADLNDWTAGAYAESPLKKVNEFAEEELFASKLEEITPGPVN